MNLLGQCTLPPYPYPNSIDGMHNEDLTWWISNNPNGNFAKLAAMGVTYTNALVGARRCACVATSGSGGQHNNLPPGVATWGLVAKTTGDRSGGTGPSRARALWPVHTPLAGEPHVETSRAPAARPFSYLFSYWV